MCACTHLDVCRQVEATLPASLEASSHCAFIYAQSQAQGLPVLPHFAANFMASDSIRHGLPEHVSTIHIQSLLTAVAWWMQCVTQQALEAVSVRVRDTKLAVRKEAAGQLLNVFRCQPVPSSGAPLQLMHCPFVQSDCLPGARACPPLLALPQPCRGSDSGAHIPVLCPNHLTPPVQGPLWGSKGWRNQLRGGCHHVGARAGAEGRH